MIPILIIIILSCIAIFVSIGIQVLIQDGVDIKPFDFKDYNWQSWFAQVIWWILQACLFIWAMIKLYPLLN